LNQISELIEGTYWQQYYNDENGNISTQDIGWFLTFKVTDRSSAASDGVTAQDIIAVAQANGLEYELTTDKSDRSLEEWKYVIENWKLTYAIGKVSEDDKTVAYDLRVLTLPKDQWEEALAAAKEQLAADPQAEIEWATELANTYVDEDTIKELIPDFAPALNEVVTYDSDIDVTYLVYTKDIKEAWENVYRFLEINGITDQAAFEDSLKNQVVYTIDEIFVQDRLWWKLAQWNDWSPLNGAYFTIAKSETTQLWEPCVGIEFNGKWKEIFCEVTTNNLGKSMGIFIWGQAVTIATIQAKICDWRAQISGGFDKERAINTAKELNSWNMPAPLILLQEEKVSPSLWDSAFEGALIATLVWVLAIILYIFFIYGWRKAIVTASTMIMFFVVLLAFLKLIDYALSLSGIAAIILSIWMAVDANILIFERMNEEVREWKTYLSAVKTASKRSWSAIRDGQISTLLIWVLLFAYGINMFKWFGSMIVLTALLTLIINVPFITDMLEIMYQNKKD
jgi:protein-export membrane protein SecD